VEYVNNLGSSTWLTAVDFVFATGSTATVTNLGGALAPARFYRVKLLSPGEVAPTAGFSANRTQGPAPLLVTFADSSTGFITNRFWIFGDGTTTNTQATTISHLYAIPGTNTVTLQVSGPTGANSVTLSNYIVVTSSLIISKVTVTNSDVYITFTSVAGQSYRVEYADALPASSWSTAVDSILANSNVTVARHAGGAGQRMRFYRVRLLP
jgi:PKD repeat protein